MMPLPALVPAAAVPAWMSPVLKTAPIPFSDRPAMAMPVMVPPLVMLPPAVKSTPSLAAAMTPWLMSV